MSVNLPVERCTPQISEPASSLATSSPVRLSTNQQSASALTHSFAKKFTVANARWALLPSFAVLAKLLKRCGKAKALHDGQRLHSLMSSSGYDRNVYLGNLLVNMYGSCEKLADARAVFDGLPQPNLYSWNILIKAVAQNGSLDDAIRLFSKMPHRDVVSWNAMISAFSQNGRGKQALRFFEQMLREGFEPVKVTFVSALDACSRLTALREGQEIHFLILQKGYEGDLEVGNALINLYGKCASLSNARSVFGRMDHRDVVSWNAMIAALAHNGSLHDAAHFFGEMPHWNIVTWNTMIAAFSQNGSNEEALDLFRQMQLCNFKPDKITFVCALDACANEAALADGHEIHAAIVSIGYEKDLVLGTALVNTYAKCATLCDARNVFSRIAHRDVVAWNAIIAGYAQNGQGEEALDLFPQMLLEGVKPNGITFICVLTACSHTGKVDKGRQLFISMSKAHGVMHTGDHYICMVDILGRAGHLDEAENLINSMASEMGALAWLCLLCACRIHGDVERGVRATYRCIELDSKNAAPHVILSNIYAEAGRWNDVVKVREALKESGMKKQAECDCMEVNELLHELFNVVEVHSQINGIHTELERLTRESEDGGQMLHVEEERQMNIIHVIAPRS